MDKPPGRQQYKNTLVVQQYSSEARNLRLSLGSRAFRQPPSKDVKVGDGCRGEKMKVCHGLILRQPGPVGGPSHTPATATHG